jgi:hypothetical protein
MTITSQFITTTNIFSTPRLLEMKQGDIVHTDNIKHGALDVEEHAVAETNQAGDNSSGGDHNNNNNSYSSRLSTTCPHTTLRHKT